MNRTEWLSPLHIELHILDFTRRAMNSGYHGGLSLNVHAGLMCEPYENVARVLDDLYKRQMASPFGCAITLCPIWYIRGISTNWRNAVGDFGILRNTRRYCIEYKEIYNEAIKLAAEYPNQGFNCEGNPSVRELVRVREELQLPVVLERMTNNNCLLCNVNPVMPEPDLGDYGEYDDDDDEEEYDPNDAREIF